MEKETPRCKECGERTIKWFKHQVLACFYCSYCGKDTPLPKEKECEFDSFLDCHVRKQHCKKHFRII